MRINETSIYAREVIGSNVREERLQANLSQTAFSQMVAVDRSHISRLENGKANITLEILIKFADGLDIPITRLFAGLDEEPPRKCVGKREVRYGSARLSQGERAKSAPSGSSKKSDGGIAPRKDVK